jgi:hypothetical protein
MSDEMKLGRCDDGAMHVVDDAKTAACGCGAKHIDEGTDTTAFCDSCVDLVADFIDVPRNEFRRRVAKYLPN